MKLFKEQIRIADYAWLYNRAEKRTFCLIGKEYANLNSPSFRVVSYTILEVFKSKPVVIDYENMEKLINSKSLEII